jgi:hypothetical protein
MSQFTVAWSGPIVEGGKCPWEFVDLSGKENLTGDERFGCSLNVTF